MHRIEVFPIITDTRAAMRERKITGLGIEARIIALTDTYTIDKNLFKEQLEQCALLFINPVIEKYSIDDYCIHNFEWVVDVGFLPGVTDNIGATAHQTIEDCLCMPVNVYSSQTMYLVGGTYSEIQKIATQFANPLINKITIRKRNEPLCITIPKVSLQMPLQSTAAALIDLDVSDAALVAIGNKGINGPLALDGDAMKAIQNYFRNKGRKPTDVELESLAQTWSEHCKHRIFAAQMNNREGLFKTYIQGATERILNMKWGHVTCPSVFVDNSGALVFDDKYLVTHKVETHNSPSALDPFGGAITGILGVNRDCLGFGTGAKPIINTYGFCFGIPEDNKKLYRTKNVLMLSPKRIMEGVIEGVRVGGNCSGIPTTQGFMLFNEQYRAKPLVFVGTVGFIPRTVAGKPSHEKKALPEDYILMIGGKVGVDGVHGATFSSEALNAGSPATAVQIGDPITQKKMADALLEARGLYNSITDNGAGGLSCSIAEMAKESNGCFVQLENIPTKYAGMAPWQLWVSESQERMTIAVPPERVEAFLSVMKKHGVEATTIGKFTHSGKCTVKYGNETVMDLELDFLHNGLPKKKVASTDELARHREPILKVPKDLTHVLTEMLNRANICSREFISRQYDHEVQGGSVLKPLIGKGRVNADATVARPLLDSYRGIALSQGIFPSYGDIDAYWMAACAIDYAVRNIIAVGGKLEQTALLDNFCWCSPNDPKRLGQLKRAAEACYNTAVMYGTPFISGKDSMHNDFRGFDEYENKISLSIPPTILISSIGIISDIRKCISMDFKKSGDVLYIIGKTRDELGGSEYYAMNDVVGKNVPMVRLDETIQLYGKLEKAIEQGLVESAHAVGLGGLAVSLAKCAIAGRKGVHGDINQLHLPQYKTLFSESPGRFIVSVSQKNAGAFEKMLECMYFRIGYVTPHMFFVRDGSKLVINTTLTALERVYKVRFNKW